MEANKSIPQMPADFPLAVTRPIYTAFSLINADISTHIILKQLAKKAGTNEYHLKRGFREIFNTSVYQYLLECRMNKAELLVRNSTIPQKDIAVQCGYETPAGFVTAFRKHFGKPPGEWRKYYLLHSFH
jgi:AraC-like DNA-binding protein